MTIEANHELTLQSINRRLGELFNADPLPLSSGGSKSASDPLWIWGVMGGKNVGKSTLINALAGKNVVQPNGPPDEGTTRPAAYHFSDDAEALRARFSDLHDLALDYHPDAPPSMRGLVLIDLPDFDSTFTSHTECVQRLAPFMDGVVWVTTPKKLGDLRAADQIAQVLKDRANFVYVVNKIDWLLAQARVSPHDELQRLRASFDEQVSACSSNGGSSQVFAITARHRTVRDCLEAISESRIHSGLDKSEQERDGLTLAVTRVIRDFQALHSTLTTPPNEEVAQVNKRANSAYQSRVQAQRILDHYRPIETLDKLLVAIDDQAIQDIVHRSLSPDYSTGILKSLNHISRLESEWTAQLFRARICNWPGLGFIAWPITGLVGILRSLRRFLPPGLADRSGDPFRRDGLSLINRTEAILAGIQARLASVSRKLRLDWPSAAALEADIRSGASEWAGQLREAAIEPYMTRPSGFLGRMIRGVIPWAVLLWFPFVQPILDGGLSMFQSESATLTSSLLSVVRALSASNVLLGLLTAIMIVAGLTAGIYSLAFRDSLRASHRLNDATTSTATDSFAMATTTAIVTPFHNLAAELQSIITQLQSLADSGSQKRVTNRIT